MNETTTTTEIRPTGQLKDGDIIRLHGMRLMLMNGHDCGGHPASADDTRGKVRAFRGVIISGTHPMGWDEDYWTVQGNDWATWSVEV